MMKQTIDPHIDHLLKDLLSRMREILGEKLLGLYLYGSLVWGDFDPEISDIDMLALLETDLSESECTVLKKMHEKFAKDYPAFDNRIEVQYLAKEGLKTFRTQESPMTIISPGDPLHTITVDKKWLMNWYFVQEYGVILFGPDPKLFIDYISKDEFLQTAKDHAKMWQTHIVNTKHSRPYQGYAIMTLCRAFYTIKHGGEQVSKKKAGKWVAKEMPEYAELIHNAFQWRKEFRNKDIDHEATYPETEKFVKFLIDQILA